MKKRGLLVILLTSIAGAFARLFASSFRLTACG
jgi:hypothetical protein